LSFFIALLGLLASVSPANGSKTGPADRPAVVVLGRRPGGYWSPQVLRVEGSLAGSLYRSFALVLPDSLLNARERAYMAWEIAEIFRWQADFTREIRPGDHFRLIFERLISQDGEVRYGRLLAADITLRGQKLEAYEFDDPQGKTAFYDGDGNSLHRDFLRVPVEFKRISSEFGARFHPILQRWRSHEGIDYAASSGSPVMAVADGRVVRAGSAGGYGRMVEIAHGNGVVTRYAHLRGFAAGLRSGSQVTQGQVLGFVGKTGLATGPHLHFELRVRGQARDPNEITSGAGPSVPASQRTAFLGMVAQYGQLFDYQPELASR
jgi:murein DD-endopeptidase MepM/ murein hydrolase activator NlpD